MLKEKNILVVGASGLLGQIIATDLLKNGANLILHHNSKNIDSKNHPSILGVVNADISTPLGCYKLIDKVEEITNNKGGLHQIIFASGINLTSKKTIDIRDEDWESTIAVNISALFYCSKRVIPLITESIANNKIGRIIYISSIFGINSPTNRCAYSVSKHGVIGLTQTLSKELASNNILVNCVSPGPMWGENVKNIFEKNAKEENIDFLDYKEKRFAKIPLKRFAEPSEVANVVTFLCSDKASYLTGLDIPVTGGAIE